jgi:hypothetical protein
LATQFNTKPRRHINLVYINIYNLYSGAYHRPITRVSSLLNISHERQHLALCFYFACDDARRCSVLMTTCRKLINMLYRWDLENFENTSWSGGKVDFIAFLIRLIVSSRHRRLSDFQKQNCLYVRSYSLTQIFYLFPTFLCGDI